MIQLKLELVILKNWKNSRWNYILMKKPVDIELFKQLLKLVIVALEEPTLIFRLGRFFQLFSAILKRNA